MGTHASDMSVHAAMMSHSYRCLYHGADATSLATGVRSPGYVGKHFGHARYISTAPGANKMWELTENPIISASAGVNNTLLPIVFSQVQNAANGNADLAGEALQGISIGSFNITTPWQTNYAFAGSGPVMQLRYNFVLTRWEVLVWDFDGGVAPDVYACDIQPTFRVDIDLKELRLEYLPAEGAGNTRLNAYINGELAKTVTGERMDNIRLGANFCEAGYFITNGSGAASEWEEAGFYGGRIFQPWLLPTPRNP